VLIGNVGGLIKIRVSVSFSIINNFMSLLIETVTIGSRTSSKASLETAARRDETLLFNAGIDLRRLNRSEGGQVGG
jgi:hypothetical protein